MVPTTTIIPDQAERPSRFTREALVEQILWLIRLRWVAVGSIVAAALIASHVFPVLTSAVPVYICAGVLLLCNLVYFLVATKEPARAGPKDIIVGIVQVEADLVILTAVLYFSGGIVNPFFMFYVFHIIIATIILPRNLSFAVGLTAILFFGLLAVCELHGGSWLGYYPLRFSAGGGLWRNPVYVLGSFVAFVCTVVLAQYLTRIVIARMAAKELEAARNSDLLDAVIRAMSEGLIFVASDGAVTICNPAAKLWRKNDAPNKNGDSLADFPAVLTRHIEGLFSKGHENAGLSRTIEFETGGRAHRHIEAKASSVLGTGGQKLGYVIVGQDLTEHKKLTRDLLERSEQIAAINEMLKRSQVEMAQREKMVAIGQMAAGIAHEIGNPLASLSSVAQYLGRKLGKHEEKEQLQVIEHQVKRISNILKRMLSLSRPATGECRWVDVNELIENTLSLVKFDKRMQSVDIASNTGADIPMIWMNPQLLEQVLLNVFINAMDAIDMRQDEQQNTLEVTRGSKDGMIEIGVRDTGVGMSPEVRERAFDSFFTTKEIGKGTGLGLFISRNLVREAGGSMDIQSQPGRGTIVTILIPITPKKDVNQRENLNGDHMAGTKCAGPICDES